MDDPAQRLQAGRLMPNVRGDKRRTIVIPDALWDALYRYAAARGQSNGAVIREQIRELVADGGRPGLTPEWADAVTVVQAPTGWQVRADAILRGTYSSKAKAELVQQQLIQARREAIESGEGTADAADA
jgi:hypothetical protein